MGDRCASAPSEALLELPLPWVHLDHSPTVGAFLGSLLHPLLDPLIGTDGDREVFLASVKIKQGPPSQLERCNWHSPLSRTSSLQLTASTSTQATKRTIIASHRAVVDLVHLVIGQ